MKKEIRKALLEVKEKKETILLEQEIVKSRILTIIEDVNKIDIFKKLPEEKKLFLSFKLMNELSYLEKNSLLNEGFMDTLKGIFGAGFYGIIETIAEPVLNLILTKVGFKSNSFLKKFIISFLTTRPSELINAFTDCKVAVKLLAESLIEANVMMLQQHFEAGGLFTDWIRNTLGNEMKDSEIVSAIENKFEGVVCDLFSKFSGKASEVAAKLNPSMVPAS